MKQLEALRKHVLTELKVNYSLTLFCLLPGIDPRENQVRRNATRIGITPEEVDRFTQLLIDAEFWRTSSDGEIVADFDLLDFGEISVQEYLSLTVCIISKLSTDKSYEYDTLSLATSRKHIRNFVKTVNVALKDLYNNSKDEIDDKNCLFSWTHMGVIELESKDKSQYWEKK